MRKPLLLLAIMLLLFAAPPANASIPLENADLRGMTRLSNRMFGFLVDLPGDWRVAPSGVRDDRSGIGITLPKRAKWPPPLEVVVLAAPASPQTGSKEALRAFVGSVGTTRKFTTVAGPVLSGGGEIQWLESRQKKGSRILVGALRRPQPPYPGILLESPQNIPEVEGAQSPHFYRPAQQLTRLSGDLDYFIMIEGAPAAFEKNRADLELLLRNLVVE